MRSKNLGYYLNRVHELPLRTVMKKALMKSVSIAACKLQKAKARLSPVHISDKQLLESLNGFAIFQEALSHIRDKWAKFLIRIFKTIWLFVIFWYLPIVHKQMVESFLGSPTKLFEIYIAMRKAIGDSKLRQVEKILKHNETASIVKPSNEDAFVKNKILYCLV